MIYFLTVTLRSKAGKNRQKDPIFFMPINQRFVFQIRCEIKVKKNN